MPIYDNAISYEDMKKIAQADTCGQCGGLLTVAWGGAFGYNGYILRCANNIEHDSLSRHDKEYEKKLSNWKEFYKMDSKSLMTMDEKQMMERVGMAKFPQELNPAEKKLLANVAITYGFDPIMKEVTIYQGNPYVSIDGRYRKAQESGELDGVESRPATIEERKAWGIPDGDYFYRAEVWKRGSTRPFVGWGRVFEKEYTNGKGYKPVESNPQRMAEKRAEAQALRKGFHIPLPSFEDIGSPEYEPSATVIVEEVKEDSKPKPKAQEKAKPKTQDTPQTNGEPRETASKAKLVLEGIKDMGAVESAINQGVWPDVLGWAKREMNITGNRVSEVLYLMSVEQRKQFDAELANKIRGQQG